MECKLEMLRTKLTQILDESPPTFRKIGDQAKYVDGSLMILYLKRDHAKQRLEEVVRSVQQQLLLLQKQMNHKIDASVAVKEQKLKQEKESMMKHVRSTAAGIYQIEGILEIGQEAKLAEHGPKLLEELNELLKWDLKQDRLDINHLEFIANTNLFTKFLNDPSLFGYVQTIPNLNPATVCIANTDGFFIEKAFRGLEEIIIISVGDKYVEGSSANLQVNVLDNSKNEVPTKVKDNKDGTFTARFTPVHTGFLILSIKLYATHIPDSPYTIMVLDSPADVGLDLDDFHDSVTKSKKRTTISRLAIDAVKKHITDNPPVKEHPSPTEKNPPIAPNTNTWNSLGLSPVKKHNRSISSERGAAGQGSRVNFNPDDGPYVPPNTRSAAETGSSGRADASPTRQDLLRLMGDPLKRYTNREPSVPPNTPSEYFVDKNKQVKFSWGEVGGNRVSYNHFPSSSAEHVLTAKPPNNTKTNFSNASSVPPTNATNKSIDKGLSERGVSDEKPIQSRDKLQTCQLRKPVLNADHFYHDKPVDSHQKFPPASKDGLERGQGTKDKTPGIPKQLPPASRDWLNKEQDHKNKTADCHQKLPAASSKEESNRVQGNECKTADSPKKLFTESRDGFSPDCKDKTADSPKQLTPASRESCFRGRRSPFGRTLRRNQSHLSTSQTLPTFGREEEENWEDNLESSPGNKLSQPMPENSSITQDKGMDKNNNIDGLLMCKVPANDKSSQDRLAGSGLKIGHLPDTSAQQTLVKTSPLEEHIKKKPNTDIAAKFVRQIGHRGSGEGCLRFPLGVTVSPDKDIIVCDNGNSMVKVFTWEGRQKFYIGSMDGKCFRRPSAVVCNAAGDIFVKDDYCIKVFDKTGKRLREFGIGKLNRPYGLIINKNDELALIDHERYGMSVMVYSQDGRLIKRSKYLPSESASWRGAKCRFIHSIGNQLYVVDLGKSCIYVTNFEGADINVIGTPGNALGQFYEPSGITGDQHGNLLIADSRNNRIQLYQTKGDQKFHGFVDIPTGILRPSDIHLTADGYLCVVNYIEHCVKVFKIHTD